MFLDTLKIKNVHLSHTFQSILHDLHSNKFAPVYLFDGEEPFFIDELTNYIEEHALDEAGKAFDQVVMYGRDVDYMAVIDEAKRYPMMGERRVIIVKEAQNIKNPDLLLSYIQNPMPNNILVIAHKYKKMDGKKAVTKYLRKHHVYLESKKLYDSQIPGWIQEHLKAQGYHIGHKAAALLAEFVGSDLSRLNNEIGKLMLVIPKSQNITPQDIEKNIGISKDYNNFELVSALAHKDVLKANKIAKFFSQDPKNHPPVLTTAAVYYYFSRLLLAHTAKDKSSQSLARLLRVNPYFLGDYTTGMRHYPLRKVIRIISYLREYDMRSKGVDNVSTSNYDLLRELIFKITH